MFGHTKRMAENPIQFVWERPDSSALLGPSLDKFEKIRIKVGLVLVAICDKTEYTN